MCDNEYNVGDIYVSTWGYEQTNNDYYQIVKKTDKTVTIRPIRHTLVEEGTMCGKTMPIKDAFCENVFIKNAKTCRMRDTGGLKISSCAYAHKWDGKPVFCSWWY